MTRSIRDATPTDLDALRTIYRRATLSNAGDRGLLRADPRVLELSATSLTVGRTRVALEGDEVVGFARSVAHEDRLELDALFVEPDRMRQGVGRDLVLDAITIARTAGLGSIEVTANEHALAFYDQAGFEPIGQMDTPLGVRAPRLRLRVDRN